MFWKTAHHRRLLIGDVLLLLILTVIGFLSHKESPFQVRMLATWVSLLVAWLWLAPWFGLFDERIFLSPRQVWWRTAWAWTAVAPLGTLLRAIWLNATVIPVFALVIFGLHTTAYVIWRLAYAWWGASRQE